MDNYFIRTEYDGTKTVLRVDTNGVIWIVGSGVENSNYISWLEEGNTPQEWKPE